METNGSIIINLNNALLFISIFIMIFLSCSVAEKLFKKLLWRIVKRKGSKEDYKKTLEKGASELILITFGIFFSLLNYLALRKKDFFVSLVNGHGPLYTEEREEWNQIDFFLFSMKFSFHIYELVLLFTKQEISYDFVYHHIVSVFIIGWSYINYRKSVFLEFFCQSFDFFSYLSRGLHTIGYDVLSYVSLNFNLFFWFLFRVLLLGKVIYYTKGIFIVERLTNEWDKFILYPLFVSIWILQLYWFYCFLRIHYKITKENVLPELKTFLFGEKKETEMAIIGIGCKYPGCSSPDDFIDKLLEGHSFISNPPKGRFKKHVYYSKNNEAGKCYQIKGGYFKKIYDFDNKTFSISKSEAKNLDPQQRILLEVALECLEDSNIRYRGSSTGVFVGAGSNDHPNLLLNDRFWMDGKTPLGNALSILANRVSYIFDLRGPSLTLDTACSSSSVALSLAFDSLRRKKVDCALVGGVHICIHPANFIGYSKLNVASKTGSCKPFSTKADGYVRGEGCGFILLKPLEKAKRDGDHIYSVISSVQANHDGDRCLSLSAPSKHAQKECLRKAMKESKITPEDVFYVEAHGTGTIVGDPIELSGIEEVMCKKERESDLFVGSVKANTGHVEFGSGVTSVIKCAKMLEREIIVPQINIKSGMTIIKNPKMKIAFKKEKMNENMKYLSIHNYGIGGSNTVCIMKKYERPKTNVIEQKKDVEAGPYLYILSAMSEESLEKRIVDMKKFHEKRKWDEKKFMLSLNTLKKHEFYKIKSFGVGETFSDAIFSNKYSINSESVEKLCFVFSGQGTQNISMGRSMYNHFRVFRNFIDKCDVLHKKLSGYSLVNDLGFFKNDFDEEKAQADLKKVDVTLPLLVFVQIAQIELLKSFGIHPDLVVGHSFGEISALYASGKIELEKVVSIVFERARLMKKVDGQGKMIAIECKPEVIEEILINAKDAWIACYNSPTSFTVGGKHDEIEKISKICKKKKILHKVLNISNAYHTPLLSSIEKESVKKFNKIMKTRIGDIPNYFEIPMYSTVNADLLSDSDANGVYLWKNIIKPVKFNQTIQAISNDYNNVGFWEISSHPVLLNMVSKINPKCHTYFGNKGKENKEKENVLTFLKSIGKLISTRKNFNVDWEEHYGKLTERIKMPTYSFSRSFCRKESPLIDSILFPKITPKQSFFAEKLDCSNDVYKSNLNIHSFPFLEGHKVQGNVIFPAAGILEMFFECFQGVDVTDFKILKPIPVSTENIKYTVVSIEEKDGIGEVSFKTGYKSTKWEKSAICKKGKRGNFNTNELKTLSSFYNSVRSLNGETEKNKNIKVLSSSVFYKRTKYIGLEYTGVFKSIKTVYVGDEEAIGVCNLKSFPNLKKYYIHPALLDCCFQVMIAASDSLSKTYIPTTIGQIHSFLEEEYDLTDAETIYIYSKILNVEDEFAIGDIEVFRESNNELLFEIKNIQCNRLYNTKEESDKTKILTQVFEPYGINNLKLTDMSTEELDKSSNDWNQVYNSFPLLKKILARYYKNHSEEIFSFYNTLPEDRKKYVDWLRNMTKSVDSKEIEEIDTSLIHKIPHFQTEAKMIERIGQNLAEIIKNENNATSRIMFSDNLLASGYRSSVTCLPYLLQMGEMMKKVVKEISGRKKCLRILELGSGTGGLSSKILPVLNTLIDQAKEKEEDLYVQYYFTDVSSGFFKEAKKEFKNYEFVKYKVLDVNKSFKKQTFYDFDIIVAFNVVHAARDLKYTLGEIKKTMVKGGLFFAVEPIGVDFVHFMFGVFKEWWDFKDDRKECCLTRSEWEKTLFSMGFDNVKTFGVSNHVHSILFCQKNNGDKDFGSDQSRSEKNVVNSLSYESILVENNVVNLFKIMRKKIKENNKQPVLVVTKGASIYDKEICSENNTIRGFIKCLKGENPTLNIKTLDFPKVFSSEEIQDIVSKKRNIIFKNSMEYEFVYDGKKKELLVPRLVTTEFSKDEQQNMNDSFIFKENKAYVLSGGLGNLGFLIIKWMASKGARYVVALSRSGKMKKSQRREIEKLEQKYKGLKIVISKTDICNKSQVRKCYEDIFENDGMEIGGVFHLAMVLNDKRIEEFENEEQFRIAYDVKKIGAENLFFCLNKGKEDFSKNLDFFFMFSSIASILGNPSQSNYVSGNSFLDMFCFELREKYNVKAYTLALPFIDELGSVDNDLSVRSVLASKGFAKKLTPPSHVFYWIEKMISDPKNDRITWILPYDNFDFKILTEDSPLVLRAGHLWRDEIKEIKNIGKFSRNTLKMILSDLLEIKPEEIKNDEKLVYYGLDSLIGVELANTLKDKYGIVLNQMEILSGITVNGVMQKAESVMEIDNDPQEDEQKEKTEIKVEEEEKEEEEEEIENEEEDEEMILQMGMNDSRSDKNEHNFEKNIISNVKKMMNLGVAKAQAMDPRKIMQELNYVAKKAGLYNVTGKSKGKFFYAKKINHEESEGKLEKNEKKIIKMLDFASCSYLDSSEFYDKKNSIGDDYGYTALSTAYYEPDIVESIYENFSKCLGTKNILLTISTTIGNMDCINTICEIHDNNCILALDQSSHNSLVRATKLISRSIPLKMIKNLDYDKIEELCKKNQNKTIVFVADGVFSVEGPQGACIDPKKVVELLNKYDNLEIYIDDAHGFGWMGENGRGWTLGQIEHIPERLTVIGSLRKGVSGYGAIIVVGSAERKYKFQGKMTSWSYQTGNLPSAYALNYEASKFLLSEEYKKSSQKLKGLIDYRNKAITKYGLNTFYGHTNPTPISTLRCPISKLKYIYKYFNKLYYEKGFFVNILMYPTVPLGKFGIRFCVRRCHENVDIDNFLKAVRDLNNELDQWN